MLKLEGMRCQDYRSAMRKKAELTNKSHCCCLPDHKSTMDWWKVHVIIASVAFCMTYCETHKTMNTRNINFTEYYCVAKKKPMRREKTKLQTARVIINFSLWFCGLLSRPELYCDWSLHNKYS